MTEKLLNMEIYVHNLGPDRYGFLGADTDTDMKRVGKADILKDLMRCKYPFFM